MFLVYYGLMRHFTLHVYPPESYLKNYQKLPKSEERVVIHFQGMGKNMKAFISSLLDQTVRVDEIAMSLPYKDMGKIPGWLKKIVSVYGYSVDYGKEGQIVPAVLREEDSNTRIIVVEPGHTYGKDFVEEILYKNKDQPKKVIQSKHAVLVQPEFFTTSITDQKKVVDQEKLGKWLQAVASTGKTHLPYSENYKCF